MSAEFLKPNYRSQLRAWIGLVLASLIVVIDLLVMNHDVIDAFVGHRLALLDIASRFEGVFVFLGCLAVFGMLVAMGAIMGGGNQNGSDHETND